MEQAKEPAREPISFETNPKQYRHWKLSFEGDQARLHLASKEDAPLRPGYQLKLNSYDLGVDIELADAIERIRFEHPEVRAVVPLHAARNLTPECALASSMPRRVSLVNLQKLTLNGWPDAASM